MTGEQQEREEQGGATPSEGLDRLVERVRRQTLRPFTPYTIGPWFFERARSTGIGSGRVWTPKVDIVDLSEAILVMAELPGIDEGDARVSVRDRTLTIEGERRNSLEIRAGSFHRIESSYGRFRRNIRLPASVDPDSLRAKYQKGVLVITLSKKGV